MKQEDLFTKIYQDHWDLLYRITMKKTGSHEDTLDILQETFKYIWENFDRLNLTEDKTRAYLITCLYYRILNFFRKTGVNAKQQKHFQHYMQTAENVKFDKDILVKEQELEAIQIAIAGELNKMPERMKDIFQEVYYKGKSVEEVSESLNISDKTVRNQLSIAKNRLKILTKKHSGSELLPLILFIINDITKDC